MYLQGSTDLKYGADLELGIIFLVWMVFFIGIGIVMLHSDWKPYVISIVSLNARSGHMFPVEILEML